MKWKLPATVLLGAACVVAIVLVIPVIDVKISIAMPPEQTPCQPLKLSIELSNGQPVLAVDGQPTTETRLLDDLSKRRGTCPMQSTPIYIYADRTLKYGDFMRFDDQLGKAGYRKVYLKTTGHPAS
jgi:biopolymer transport protein ExbD